MNKNDDNRLTPFEARILRAAAEGKTAVETARQWHRSPATIYYHRARARARLGARTLVQAVAIAVEAGLLGGPPRPIEPIAPRQRSLIYVKLGELDAARGTSTAKQEALAAASLRIGRPITSINDLSYEQASDTIDWLKAQLLELEAA